MVLANHLALFNVALALDADNAVPDPDKQPKNKSEEKHQQYKAFQAWSERREFVDKLRFSRAEYIRHTGYHELFGLEPPEEAKPKTTADKVRDGRAAARRAVRNIMRTFRGDKPDEDESE